MASYAAGEPSPLLMEALLRFQGFSTSVTPPAPRPIEKLHDPWTAGGDGLPTGAAAARRFERLTPNVRASIVSSEVMPQWQVAGNGPASAHTLTFGGTTLLTLTRPDYDLFARQAQVLIRKGQSLRYARAAEILAQVHTPEAQWCSITGMRADTHRWTFEFIDAALDLTLATLMRLKHSFLCPRPFEYTPAIQPVVMTPGHDAWPSGHATESMLTARLLEHFSAQAAGQPGTAGSELVALAQRIAENREVAGLHFPVDSAAGQILGDTLAKFFIAACTAKPTNWTPRAFAPTDANRNLHEGVSLASLLAYAETGQATAPLALPKVPWLTELWDRAIREWQ